MYYEIFNLAADAIQREKSLKGKGRQKKNALISTFNPKWDDLSLELF
jgi:putative endonuclease